MEPRNPALDRYVIGLARRRKRPRVCFVPTATGDSERYVARFHRAMKRHHDVEATELLLYDAPEGSLRDFVLRQDVLYVGGGNTRNLMALWREWGLDRILKAAWKQGVVLAGVSAGALCWFEEGVTDSVPGKLTTLRCTGILPGSFCPHYDGEPGRRPAYRRMVKSGALGAGLAADDGAAAHFRGRRLHRCVSSRAGAQVHRVLPANSGVDETPLVTDPVFEPRRTVPGSQNRRRYLGEPMGERD